MHKDIHLTKFLEISIHWTNDKAFYFRPSSVNGDGYHAYFIRIGRLYFIPTFYL